MIKSGEVHRHRTRVFFFLILSVAVLWAIFLLHKGEVLQFFFLFASLAAINPVVGFIEMRNNGKDRNLLIFYCMILVALLWASFLLYLGVHLWVSLFIFIIAVGVPLLLRAMGETRTISVT
ncbi:MAG: hypothetical protein M0R30_08425 [Methanoregula sp.]|jgi:small basic protein|uniref:hypothetical protein n=1 Tax=Methanoregula sp. TaxID=2052170 RepID=UPI0025CDB6E4|nr:hypothetical protein [Methanoregula sp.]MCK9631657.1 hypothetical protein [Methanoregula sp.]